MLDIKRIREQPDFVKTQLARAGEDPAQVDEVLALDTRRRELLNQVEALKATRNAVSKEIGKMKGTAEREAKIAEMRGVGDQIAATVKDVATGLPLKALVGNDGKIKADGGRVELTAVAARQVVEGYLAGRHKSPRHGFAGRNP